MRIIKTAGLFFLYKSLYTGSYRAWAILLNGLIYHSYETVNNYDSKTTTMLRNYDICCNFLFCIYTAYYFPISRIYGIKSLFNFFTICILHTVTKNRKTTFRNILIDSAHVLMIQLPLFKGLELSLDITPTFSCIV